MIITLHITIPSSVSAFAVAFALVGPFAFAGPFAAAFASASTFAAFACVGI